MSKHASVLLAVVLALLPVAPAATLGQTAGQITPPSFRPPLQGGTGTVRVPDGPGLQAPAGADRLTVRIGRFAVEGTLPALEGETRAITAPFEGKTVSAAAIFDVAQALEHAYVQAGYVLARVVLPAQELADDGPVRLTVIDGFIERIDVSGVPEPVRGRISALLAPLEGVRGIGLDRIERRLLLAGDTPGVTLRSTLAAGDAPGASVLVVEARHRPVGGMVGFDNALSASLRRYTLSLGVDINAPTGHGELLYARAGGYPNGGTNGFFADRPRNRSLAGGLVLPLGTDGLSLNLEATEARATPLPEDGFGFTSVYSRYSARLRHPLLRSRAATVNTELAFDAIEERVRTVGAVEAPLSLDRLRVLRAGTDARWSLPWGVAGDALLSGQLTGSLGLDALGARSADDATALEPLSRDGSRPDFRKLELVLAYSQSLTDGLALDLRASGQTAFGQALPRAEQFGLAAPSGLSGFTSGTLQGDSGYVLRGELQAPWPAAVPGGVVALAPYAFGAAGAAVLNRPTALEERVTRGASYGLGLRAGGAVDASANELALTLEWARGVRAGESPDDRLLFTTQLRF
ncbi:hypothetical protein [Azospirillum endophyticum]